MNNNILFVRGALLLALILLAQSLRFIFPLPPIFAMFIIGTLVNAFLLISVLQTNVKITAVICLLAPLVAFMQGQLPLAPFIFVVAAGNLAYILIIYFLQDYKKAYVIIFAALGKTAVLFAGLQLTLNIVALPEGAARAITIALSWPQLLTASVGACTGLLLLRRLAASKKN